MTSGQSSKRLLKVLVLVAVMPLASGCVTVNGIKDTGQTVMTGTSSDRHIYFLPGRTGPNATAAAVCPEPHPDTATQRAITAAITGTGGRLGTEATAEATLNYQTSMVQLAGRTQTVVLARDLLFQACLMRANGYFTDEQLVQTFSQTIGLVRDLGLSDKVQSAANAARAGVGPATISSALSYGNERDQIVTDIAQALLSKPQAERRTFVDNALACPSGAEGAFCRVSADSVMGPNDLVAMQAAVGSMPSEHITALRAALARGG